MESVAKKFVSNSGHGKFSKESREQTVQKVAKVIENAGEQGIALSFLALKIGMKVHGVKSFVGILKNRGQVVQHGDNYVWQVNSGKNLSATILDVVVKESKQVITKPAKESLTKCEASEAPLDKFFVTEQDVGVRPFIYTDISSSPTKGIIERPEALYDSSKEDCVEVNKLVFGGILDHIEMKETGTFPTLPQSILDKIKEAQEKAANDVISDWLIDTRKDWIESIKKVNGL